MADPPVPDDHNGSVTGMGTGDLLISQLPPAMAAFVRAASLGNLDALLATFADDALVNDQLRDYCGREAIAAWAARDVIGERLALKVVATKEHYGHSIVTTHADGLFDKRGLPRRQCGQAAAVDAPGPLRPLSGCASIAPLRGPPAVRPRSPGGEGRTAVSAQDRAQEFVRDMSVSPAHEQDSITHLFASQLPTFSTLSASIGLCGNFQ